MASKLASAPILLPGIPPALQARVAKLGLSRSFDLVLHLPLRYEDETALTPIAQLPAGMAAQVEAVVQETRVSYRPRRQLLSRVSDDSGELWLRFFNFYPSQQQALSVGARVRVFGEARNGFFGSEMAHPRFRVLRKDDVPLPQALTPVYPTTAGVSQAVLRKAITQALQNEALADTVDAEFLASLGLPGLEPLLPFRDAVITLHHPPVQLAATALQDRSHPAWRRMKFDELLAQQLSMRMHYRARRARRSPTLASLPASATQSAKSTPSALTDQLLASLPWQLTSAQQRAWHEIEADLALAHPMHRLLQGDVGSGKTVVAALAVLRAIENGWQATVMAPTEILAEQHRRKFGEWLIPLGISVAWLSGSQSAAERRAALQAIASGEARLAIGTHALFQDGVVFDQLGLVVVDEQHRFGVAQRLALRNKGGGKARNKNIAAPATLEPHALMMSATPIPRTLSMSYYADLDLSVIDGLPPGRKPVATRLVAESRREEVIHRIRDACAGGVQAYWVCPLVEESETLQLQTAVDTFESLRAEFPDLRVGLLHGRMHANDKAAVMAAFSAGELQLLVATTVIEVGVDVPNASLMVIEHAERFGLSQLHQLRGRVGRGARESFCILLYRTPLSETARQRLKVIFESQDGFAIARADLELRGPGEYLGARQSGAPLLRFADILQDEDLVLQAQQVADRMLAQHPERVEAHLQRWLGVRADYLQA